MIYLYKGTILDTYIIILSSIQIAAQKQNIKMDIRLYFWSASKSSVVSSSNDSEDGYESDIDVQANPPKHCSSSTSKPPSKTGFGIRRYNKKWKETFPWLEFDENLQGAFCKLCKKGGRSLQKTGGTPITKLLTNWKRWLRKWNYIQKVKCTFYPVNWMWKLIELEQKNPLSASLKNVGEQQRLKIGRQLKLESDVLTF